MNRLDYYAAGSKYNNYALAKRWTFWQRDDRRREPILFAVAFCIADELYNPFSGEVLALQKSQFAYLLLAVDLATIFLTVFLINLLNVRFKEYSEIFDKRNVEMRDFSLRFGNLPYDLEYGGTDIVLQAQLWNHIEITLQKKFEAKAVRRSGIDDGLLADLSKQKPWEIADINFAKVDTKETDLLEAMAATDRERKTKIFRATRL